MGSDARWTVLPIALVATLLAIPCYSDQQCNVHMNFIGYTIPEGDILIEYGQPLEIYCSVNNLASYSYEPSQYLFIVKGTKEVESDQIEIVNASTIRYYDPKPKKQSTMYYCMLRRDNEKKAVCINKVMVDSKPNGVKDLDCVSENWENLTCTWTPEKYMVNTDYDLSFALMTRRSPVYKCPEKTERSCFWDLSTNPIYRPAHEFYNFTMNVSNFFGHSITHFYFRHYEHVHSGPPQDLKALNSTSESIFLSWRIPKTMETFPRGLHHRILYTCEYDVNRTWQLATVITDRLHDKEVTYNLTGLKYATALFDIRVSLRSGVASQERMWSNNASTFFRTKPKLPGYPPKTILGSFQLVSHGGGDLNFWDVYIYWQQIPKVVENGANFSYQIDVHTTGSTPIQSESTASYAKFTKLQKTAEYKFMIRSKNSVGYSVNESVVTVPSEDFKVKSPSFLTKTDYEKGRYLLSWEPPKLEPNQSKITNYTIFWCKHDNDRPYQCSGYLDWIIIPNDLTEYNITVEEKPVTQFAIAANTVHGSSGMVWAACSFIHNAHIGKIKVELHRVDVNYIDLTWRIDCKDRIGSVAGFKIYYCPIIAPTERFCNGTTMIKEINGSINTITGRVDNLMPYTTYQLAVSVITKSGIISERSEPIYSTTFEGVPSPVWNLTQKDVTNSSVTLSWRKPERTNGVIKNYLVRYNSKTVEVTAAGNEIEYKLENLSSFEEYNISVKACTTHCSEPVEYIIVLTKAGYPSKIETVSREYLNGTFTGFKWTQPYVPRGRNDLYEIRIRYKSHYENNNTTKILNVTGTQYDVVNCEANEDYDSALVSVRAVNINDGERFAGEWSDEQEVICNPRSTMVFWIFIVVLVLIICAMIFISKKAYFHCKSMQDVEVKLPPGLDDVKEPQKRVLEELPRKAPSDEEHLLEKNEGRLSGDSSGCSSGHDSVTSLEMTANVSGSSDSGTEQPRSPVRDTSSLRLRKKGDGSIRSLTKPYVPITAEIPPSYSPTPNYCMLGVNPAVKEPETIYVSVAQPVSPIPASKGYVTLPVDGSTPPWTKAPNVQPQGNYCMFGINNPSTVKNYVTLPVSTDSQSWNDDSSPQDDY